jgi:hypothetical protein
MSLQMSVTGPGPPPAARRKSLHTLSANATMLQPEDNRVHQTFVLTSRSHTSGPRAGLHAEPAPGVRHRSRPGRSARQPLPSKLEKRLTRRRRHAPYCAARNSHLIAPGRVALLKDTPSACFLNHVRRRPTFQPWRRYRTTRDTVLLRPGSPVAIASKGAAARAIAAAHKMWRRLRRVLREDVVAGLYCLVTGKAGVHDLFVGKRFEVLAEI